MKGRKPIPDGVRALTGSRSYNKHVVVCTDPPICPEWLPDGSREIWDRIVSDLARAGIVNSLDSTALSMLCVTLAQWHVACAELAKEGAIVQTPSRHSVISKWLKIKSSTEAHLLKLLQDFGMTPSSRARLSVMPSSLQDELEEFLTEDDKE